MKKIYVMVDMEGISGVCMSEQVSGDGEAYQRARKYLTWDVNACIEGCFQGGAGKVMVRDAHGGGYHIIWEELDPRALSTHGDTGRERMPGISGYDGLILLGYHAMAGTPAAILEHTMSSKSFQNLWINGEKAGEITIDAGIAGDHGVPTIMISGDDKTCREAKHLIPSVVAAEVKKGLAVRGGILLPMKKAREVIIACAAMAVSQCKKIKPVRVKNPVTMRLELISRGRVPQNRPGVKVIDGRSYEAVGRTVEEAMNNLFMD